MSQLPIEIGDNAATNEAVNYLLSGPAGLGQNFQGFSAYLPAYIRPSTRQPFDLPIEVGDPPVAQPLNPSIYLDIPINNITVPTNPGQQIVCTFTTPQATAPFAYGDQIDLAGVVAGGGDPNFYNGSYKAFSCTTTTVTLFARATYTWPAYTSGGSVGRNYMNYGNSTDCNARVTVAGPTDQVFVSAQLDLSYEYECFNNISYDVVVRISRGKGFPDSRPGSTDFLFADFVTISEKTFTKTVTVGSGTDTLEAIFTTVLDGPNLDFGYYWYILEVTFVITGGIVLQNDSQKFTLEGVTAVLGSTTTYSSISPTTVTGVGTGLVVDVELQANAGNEDYEYYDPPDGNTTINIVASGTGYQVGDELTIAGTSLGGASPANDMTLVIDSIGPPFDVTIGRATTNLRSLTAQVIKQ
jgi:hypothetical protein